LLEVKKLKVDGSRFRCKIIADHSSRNYKRGLI